MFVTGGWYCFSLCCLYCLFGLWIWLRICFGCCLIFVCYGLLVLFIVTVICYLYCLATYFATVVWALLAWFSFAVCVAYLCLVLIWRSCIVVAYGFNLVKWFDLSFDCFCSWLHCGLVLTVVDGWCYFVDVNLLILDFVV